MAKETVRPLKPKALGIGLAKWRCSSIGQSSGFLNRRFRVRSPAPPPFKKGEKMNKKIEAIGFAIVKTIMGIAVFAMISFIIWLYIVSTPSQSSAEADICREEML